LRQQAARRRHRIAAGQQLENHNVCNAFDDLSACAGRENQQIYPAALARLGA